MTSIQIVVSPESASSASTGPIPVPAGGAETLIASILTAGVGNCLIVGSVAGTGPLTGLRLAAASISSPSASNPTSGAAATELSSSSASAAGNFETSSDFLLRPCNTPQATASGSAFRIPLNLKGIVGRIDLFANSTNGATVTVDVTGSSAFER